MEIEQHERDAWDDLGDQGNGISGEHLKCAKGVWLLDDEPIGNDGLKIVVVMDTATVGQVLWQDKKIVERDTGLVADGFVAPRELKVGWTLTFHSNAFASTTAGLSPSRHRAGAAGWPSKA